MEFLLSVGTTRQVHPAAWGKQPWTIPRLRGPRARIDRLPRLCTLGRPQVLLVRLLAPHPYLRVSRPDPTEERSGKHGRQRLAKTPSPTRLRRPERTQHAALRGTRDSAPASCVDTAMRPWWRRGRPGVGLVLAAVASLRVPVGVCKRRVAMRPATAPDVWPVEVLGTPPGNFGGSDCCTPG